VGRGGVLSLDVRLSRIKVGGERNNKEEVVSLS
jgi:hypothetical protein